jgi:hypothetical protein
MNTELIARIRRKAADHAFTRARDTQEVAKSEHRDAPRGGSATNAFGESRSAPGEPPAMEYGRLFAKLDQQLQRTLEGGRAPVNYRVLEFGYQVGVRSRISDRKSLRAGRLEPRPLGAITLAIMRARFP